MAADSHGRRAGTLEIAPARFDNNAPFATDQTAMTAYHDPRASAPPLERLYQDDYLVAVAKPPGMLVHRTPLARGETRFVLQTLRDQIGRHVYPVHRLDRPTGGVLLFALDARIAATLAAAFADHRITKRYLAVVRGWGPQAVTVDAALREEDGSRPKSEMPAQPAVTHLKRLATVEIDAAIDRYPRSRYSLMEAIPETGRRHQIRRHLARVAHPIIGDAKHGKGNHNRYFRDWLDCPHLLLGAVELGFYHPVENRVMTLTAALDTHFAALLARFGWQAHAPVSGWRWTEASDFPGTPATGSTHAFGINP